MTTVGYIVRDMTGTKQHGNFAEGTPSTIDATHSKDISLNLSPSDVESYARRGQDLHITLANGESLILDGYYDTGATGGKNLFLSQEGDFIEVVLEDRASGMLFASYEPLDLTGKWSAYDDMVFLDIDRIEPVVAPLIAAPLLGGAGAAGAAGAAVLGGAAVLSGGGGGGDGGGSDTTPPTVDITSGTQSTGDIVNAAEHSGNPVITGTGEPGATVTLEINGTSRTTTVANDGSWSMAFDSSEILTGEYNTNIAVTTTDIAGNSATSTDVLVVDTVGPLIAVETVETDDVINAAEASDGVLLSGVGEAGASIEVTFQGETRTTTVAGDGSWSVSYAASTIAAGTYDSTVNVTSVDAVGNSSTYSHTVRVDTETAVTLDATQAGDGIINGAEHSAGVTLTGTAEAGATVVVTLGSTSHTVIADSSGNWSSGFSSSEIASGTYDASVSAVSTDLAGNTATTTGTVAIDTSTFASIDSSRAGGDNIVSMAESQAGVTLTGNAEPGSTVVVTVAGVSRTATVDSSGNWSAQFEAGSIADGQYDTTVSVTATDIAGNTYTTSEILSVDTFVENPGVDSVTFASGDVRRIGTEGYTDSYTVNALESNGSVSTPASSQTVDPVFGTEFTFNSPISDGTHLVVTSEDAVGNSSSTLLVLEDNATEIGSTDHAGLSQFNIDALNLDYAADVDLTLTEADIIALSDNSDTVTIHGGNDDTVTVTGATDTGTNQTIDGQSYDVYTIGTDGTTLVIEDDINVII
ncbi:hypothetical protein A9Q94_12890 [Rhodobacterales bacterium 56_14_T64]|mgnify:CR=1 FL=1|nr:hypothetical protein A9Q94_12890 [Rhodobacterales bacterium 56_14_T64]